MSRPSWTRPLVPRPARRTPDRWPSVAAVSGRRRLGLRGQVVVLAAAGTLVVAVVLVVVLQAILESMSASAVDRVLDDRAEAVISSVLATTGDDGVVVPDAYLDPGVVVYDADGLVAGSVPRSLADTFASLSTVTGTRRTDAGATYRVLAEPFTTSSGQAVVVVAEPRTPYENDERLALVVMVVAAVVLVLLAGAVAGWASGRALAPVVEMARSAERWSEHHLDRRFGLGQPTNEIGALGHALDALLDRVAQAIVAEQRLTAELAHELRTPLTSIQVTAELVAGRDDLDEQLREDVTDIQAAARAMASTIAVLLDVARNQAGGGSGRADAQVSALAAVTDAVQHYVRHAEVALDVPDDMVLDVPHDLAVRALAPVLANADRHARAVRVTARLVGGAAVMEVADDGDGVDAALADTLFEPGRSGSGGAGLGLALARRVARVAGGDVTWLPPGTPSVSQEVVAPRGATFRLSLPGRRTGPAKVGPD